MEHILKHLRYFICICVCLLLDYGLLATVSELKTTDTFQGPGIPTLDYGGARAYAKQNKTFVAFMKMRYGCAQKSIDGLNGGTGRIRYAELGMPIVAGAIQGFVGANPLACPAFFSAVMDKYYNADGPFDFVIEDPNDDVQTAVDFKGSGSWGYDKHGVTLRNAQFKKATGNKRTEFEDKYGVSLDDICVGPKMSLYNRDDTAYSCKRKEFIPYFSGSDSVSHNQMNEREWKYTSRPRKFKYRAADEGYAHGLIDSTGSSTGYNYLMHVASQTTTHQATRGGPDNERIVIDYILYYDNLQDWYKVSSFATNDYYSITTTGLIDQDSEGSIFIFDDEDSAAYATNATECLNRCLYSSRMADATSGFTFKTRDKTTMLICFQLCNSKYVSYKRDGKVPEDLTECNQVVQYKWLLKKSSAPPEPTPEPEPTPPEPVPVPEPEPQTPQYNTNVFEIAKLTDLVFEGGWEYGGYDTSITRHLPATGQLTIHMVWDGVERGMCKWADGETGKREMAYTFPYDPLFNADRRVEVSYENYFMKLLHGLVVRDRLVKYMAHEHYSNDTHNYDDSGLDLFPVTGMWFVDHDDILRCVDEPSLTNSTAIVEGSTLVLDLQTLKSGTVSIGSVNGGKAEVFSANGFHQVVQTNFYPSASGSSKLYSRFIVKKSKRDFGSKVSETEIKPMENFTHALGPDSVIRLSFPSGSKLYEFSFSR